MMHHHTSQRENDRLMARFILFVLLIVFVVSCLWLGITSTTFAQPISWHYSDLLEAETKVVYPYHNLSEVMVESILNHLVFCKQRLDRKEVIFKSCRTAPEGCRKRIETYVGYIIEAGKKYNLSPWLLAGVIYNESRFNPFATGSVGERGLMQLHPKSKRGRKARFVKDKRYRKRCKKILGNCQKEIIDLGADHLRSAIDKCGGKLRFGLSIYNTGHCEITNPKYIRRVLKAKRILEEYNGIKSKIPWCSDNKKR